MTRDEFLEKYRHRVSGMVLDAMFSERGQGGELALKLRLMLKQADALILEMWNESRPVANGPPATKEIKR